MSPPEARRSPRRRPGRKRPQRRQGLALKRRGDAPATATSRKRQRRRTVLQRNRSADGPTPVQIALRPGLGAGQTASAQASGARVLAEVPAPIQPHTGRRYATANRCGSATRSRSAARTTRAGADPLGSTRLTSCLAHRRHRHCACRDLVRAPGRAAGGAGGLAPGAGALVRSVLRLPRRLRTLFRAYRCPRIPCGARAEGGAPPLRLSVSLDCISFFGVFRARSSSVIAHHR